MHMCVHSLFSTVKLVLTFLVNSVFQNCCCLFISIMVKLVNVLFGIFFYSQETLTQLIHLQTAAKKRIAEIKDCETKIEKAFDYLAEVPSTGFMCIWLFI